MYLDTLSETSVEIIAFLSSRIRENFTVRQIAQAIGRDYKISYVMTMRLAKQQLITAEKRRPVTYCRLNLKGNSQLLAHIEGIRSNRFFAKNRDLEILTNELLAKISSPFFTMILFGSWAKGTSAKRSDLDVLFVVPCESVEKEASAAVDSLARISPIGIHEIVLTNDELIELLRQKTSNVAWEAVDNHIVPYGAQPLFKMLEMVL